MVKVHEVKDEDGRALQVMWSDGDSIYSTWLNKILFPDGDAVERFLKGQHQERFYAVDGKVYDRTLAGTDDEWAYTARFYLVNHNECIDDADDPEAARQYADWLNSRETNTTVAGREVCTDTTVDL